MVRWVKGALGVALLLLPASPAWAEPDNVIERIMAFNGLVLFAVLAIVAVALVLVLVTLVLVLMTMLRGGGRSDR